MTGIRRVHDIVVVGAGPAGRGLAHRALHAGLDVALVDPRPHAPWTATLACWSDELPDWLPTACVAAQTESIRIRSSSSSGVDLPRAYSVLDTAALQRALNINSARVVAERAVLVDNHSVTTASGVNLTAKEVIDARGAAGHGPRQTAWGMIVPRAEARPVLDGAEAVLMDWRPTGSDKDTEAASFLYIVPLDDERVLLEETCLAGEPAIPVRDLRTRLEARVSHLSMTVLGTETVSFALRGVSDKPWRVRPLMFGARGDLMHPATGYSVATSLRTADRVVHAVAAGRDPVDAVWPRSARAVQRLRLAGVRTLLSFDPTQIREFFDAFATMPPDLQRAYLSGRDDLRGTAQAMTWLFAHADNPTRRSMVSATVAPRHRRRQQPAD